MKRVLAGAAVVLLVMMSSIHFSVVYLKWTRTLGISSTPGFSALKVSEAKQATNKAICIIKP